MTDVLGRSSVSVPLEGTSPGTAISMYTCPTQEAVQVSSGVIDVTAAAQVRPVQTQVNSISICHHGSSPGGARYVTMWHTPSSITTTPYLGDGINEASLLLRQYDIAESDTVVFNMGILMSAGEQIWVECELADHHSATIYYTEVY